MGKKSPSESPELFGVPDESFAKDDDVVNKHSPLAVRLRPRTLSEIVGQAHLIGPDKLLSRTLRADRWSSMIFYGPPGTGKTTLARVISRMTKAHFVSLNAVTSNVAELRKIIEDAKKVYRVTSVRTIVFVDEIHRFNKSQQDVLMPDVENGTITLIGATTHNPSFSIIGPLLSRATVFELRPLDEGDLREIIKVAVSDPERGLGSFAIDLSEEAIKHLLSYASGDARKLLNALEIGALTTPPNAEGRIVFNAKVAEESSQRKIVQYDGDEDYHYDTISAFIKSIRGSDPDAAIYWLAKMIYAGEDIRFIVRRLIILASEDIGNADPQALILATSGLQAVEFVGLPEARIILAQIVTYLALAPKSNASYLAIDQALDDIKNGRVEEVPNHLRDKSYFGAKQMGHGEGYKYSHTAGDGHELPVTGQNYLETTKRYYHPKAAGFEVTHQERLASIRSRKSKQKD